MTHLPLTEAALYPPTTRLGVAAILMVLFALISPRRSPRPLALAVMCVFVAVWLFGATLVWGTGGPSKLRWGIALTTGEGAALLALAVLGVISAGGSLRYFAHELNRTGWILAAVFVGAFLGWSLVVRYSAVIVIVAIVIAIAAMWSASLPVRQRGAAGLGSQPIRPVSPSTVGRLLWNSVSVVLPFLVGPLFYWWLAASPKSWADPACGLAGWLPLTFIPFVVVPWATAGARTRALGRRWEAAAAAVVLAGFVALGVCVLAFLYWFGVNQCGE